MTSRCRFVSSTEPRVIVGRHSEPCSCGDREIGCLPCQDTHCVVCGQEHARAACTGCLEAARSDLREIGELSRHLDAEAVEKGVQSDAAMLAGPVADPEAWQHVAMSAIRGRLCRCMSRRQLCPALFGKTCPDAEYLADNRDELHPLFVLGGWEQLWREFLDHPTEATVTIESAARYLDVQIGYMADQVEPAFDEFARELRGCRGRLEDVLRAGEREERSHVPCVDCATRLVKVFTDRVEDDHWRCPRCWRDYKGDEYARAQHFHMEDERADRFVKVSVALGMIDRPEQTLRTWMSNGDVKTGRDAETGAILVWWPDVRDRNRDTPRRKSRSA
jgi:ribosomal protein L37AE/L43A